LTITGGQHNNTITKSAAVGGAIVIKAGPSTNTYDLAWSRSLTVASSVTIDASHGTNTFDFRHAVASARPGAPVGGEGHLDEAVGTHGITLDLTRLDQPQVVSYTLLNGVLVPNTVTLKTGSFLAQLFDSPFDDTITTAAPPASADLLALPEPGTAVV